jgi:hypothetical protein
VASLVSGRTRLRDRVLVTLLNEAGLCIGEALGLRHEDVRTADGVVDVRTRDNANGARAKTWERQVPVSTAAGSPTTHAAYRALMASEAVVVTADERESTFDVRVAGQAEGMLFGGNLTMLATTAGTRHKLDLRGAILVIEAVNEEPYSLTGQFAWASSGSTRPQRRPSSCSARRSPQNWPRPACG